MAEVKAKFAVGQFKQAVDGARKNAIIYMARVALNFLKDAVSVPNTGQSKGVKYRHGSDGGVVPIGFYTHRRRQAVTKVRQKDGKLIVTERRSSFTVYPHPSKPGEPPRLRTGFGRAHIYSDVNVAAGSARLGVRGNAIYMFFLEVWKRGRRPWLVSTIIKNKAAIAAAALAAEAEAGGRKR